MADILTGQRLLYTIDAFKSITVKEGENEQNLQRMYQLILPYGAPFEEVYEMVNVMLEEVKKIEESNKERTRQLEKEKKEKEAAMDLEEASKN